MSGDFILLGLAGVIASGAPIVLASIGETISERAGVTNLSLNGLIIFSGMMGFWVAVETDSLFLGFLTGALVGALVSAIVAFSSITLKQSQVAVGFILAITTRDLAYFLGNPIMGLQGPIMLSSPIPVLSQIPILGPLFFQQSIMTYASIILIFLAWFWIYKTRPGLMLQGIVKNLPQPMCGAPMWGGCAIFTPSWAARWWGWQALCLPSALRRGGRAPLPAWMALGGSPWLSPSSAAGIRSGWRLGLTLPSCSGWVWCCNRHGPSFPRRYYR